jgi:hypothetical protein
VHTALPSTGTKRKAPGTEEQPEKPKRSKKSNKSNKSNKPKKSKKSKPIAQHDMAMYNTVQAAAAAEAAVEDEQQSTDAELMKNILEDCRVGGALAKDLTVKIRTTKIKFLQTADGQRDLVPEIVDKLKRQTFHNPFVPLHYTGVWSVEHTQEDLEKLSLEELREYEHWTAFGGQHGVRLT